MWRTNIYQPEVFLIHRFILISQEAYCFIYEAWVKKQMVGVGGFHDVFHLQSLHLMWDGVNKHSDLNYTSTVTHKQKSKFPQIKKTTLHFK